MMARQAQLSKQKVFIVSGEGEQGRREFYTGKKTARAIRARLTRESCGGDRWAVAEIEGYRVQYHEINQWFD